MVVNINSKFFDHKKVKLSPYDRGFMLTDGVYETIRTYNGKLFKYDDHLKRLEYSLKEINLSYTHLSKLEGIIHKLIKKNNINDDAIIYLQITRGSSIPRTHYFPTKKINPTIYIAATRLKTNLNEQRRGIKVILHDGLRWMRCDIKSISLLPVVLANQKAKELGAEEAIFVRDKFITEGTHTNFFAVKNNGLYTAPPSNLILSGITRSVVIKIAKKLNIKVNEKFIKAKEVKTFKEFFITSTTKEITPVVQINDWIVNAKKIGDITLELQNGLKKITGNS